MICDVVCFSLDVEADNFERLLSDDERTRRQRFLTATLRSRYTVAHGRLREILADHLAALPQELRFAQGPQGKPRLLDANLHFNLSHSDGVGLVAVSQKEVGVDIERIRPLPEYDRIARQHFTPDEAAQLERVAPHQREAAFFALWTRKESYLKALGVGLIGLTTNPESSGWQTWELTEIAGHCAAVTVADDEDIGYRLRWL